MHLRSLNTDIINKPEDSLIVTNSGSGSYIIRNGICFAAFECTPYEVGHDVPICWTFPTPKTTSLLVFSVGGDGGHSYPVYMRSSDNALCFYYPHFSDVERIDACIAYPVI